MLDTMLADALEGFTVIEDDNGSVGQILAKQMGGYAESAGKNVGFFPLNQGDSVGLGSEPTGVRRSPDDDPSRGGRASLGSQLSAAGERYLVLDNVDYDLLIVDGISAYLFDKTPREVVDLVRRIVRLTEQKKSFIITIERALLGVRTAAYIKARADTVIIVRTDVSGDRVTRSLQLQKMRGSVPTDRLIKFTLDESGIQVDTREFLG
jgi:hypothetical protein